MKSSNHSVKGQARLSLDSFLFNVRSRGMSSLLGLLVLVIFVIPMLRLLYLSFGTKEGRGISVYLQVLREEKTWDVLSNTLQLVLGSTVLALFFGVAFAWFVAYTDIRGKRLIQVFILLPFIIPSYIVTLSWTQLMSRNGMLAAWFEPWDMYSMGGMIFVMGISHYPLVYLLTVGVFKRIPRDLEWTARASGAGRWATLGKITLPLALPGIAGGGLLAFLAGLDNFGIPAFLGIPANITVLSTYIYEQIVGFGPSAFTRAAVLSVILGIIALSGTAVQWLLVKKSKSIETHSEDQEARIKLGKLRPWTEAGLWFFLLATGCVPLISMGIHSLIKSYGLTVKWENLTWEHYRFILLESDNVRSAVTNSATLALVTTLICFAAGTAIAYYRVRKPSAWMRSVEIAVGLPYALPGIVLALAMIFAWMEPIPGWNPGIYGSVMILFIAYVTRFMILQVRGSMTALLQVDASMEEAARVSGARAVVRWKRILLPLLWPGMLTGAFFVFLVSLTELTVSSLLVSAGNETIGVVIFNFEQAGYTTYSTAFSSVIVLLILVGIAVLRPWKGRKEGKVFVK